jgi:hypothetical protein
MRTIKTVCVFCGVRDGSDAAYLEAARDLGARLAKADIDVVYGGAKIGMMGALAESVLSNHGNMIGVIPEFLQDKEVVHDRLTKLHVVHSLHARKQLMYDLADAFIVLPGGLGTLDELSEVLTWGQLGLHRKAFGILNVAGYFDAFLTFLDQIADKEMMSAEHKKLMFVEPTVDGLLDRLKSHTPPPHEKWVKRAEI